MKKHQVTGLIFSIIFIFGTITASAQAIIEAQLGGSNFVGLTLNGAYSFPLSANRNHRLTPSFGLGVVLLPAWNESTAIIHSGLNYTYKRFGFGGELSWFTPIPFIAKDPYDDFLEMIIYPNFNYTMVNKQHLYFRISGGMLLPFEQTYNDITHHDEMIFADDPIPGAGFMLGYRF